MKKQSTYTNSEEGFVLIASLLILLVLTVVGIAVNRNTTIEWQIAMNDRFHKETFYNADAATELASEVLEQALACSITGFSQAKLPGAGGNYSVIVCIIFQLGLEVYVSIESRTTTQGHVRSSDNPCHGDAIQGNGVRGRNRAIHYICR